MNSANMMDDRQDVRLQDRQLPAWVGYAATILAEAALTIILLLLHRFLPLGQFPIAYVLVIMLVAYVFGEGPAILAFFLVLFSFDFLFIPPLYTILPHAETPMGWAALAAFLMGAGIVGFVTIMMCRSRQRIERLLAQAEHEIAERKRAEEALKEEQEHKIEFYQRTIAAATDGKLVITERSEIEKMAGPTIASWEIQKPEDLSKVRHGVAEVAGSEGMDETMVGKFVLSTGEAITNAVKHADGGTASLHRMDDNLMLVVSDKGPGIMALSLPEVALKQGYSTAGTLGMGYKVMIGLSDRVYLATGPGGYHGRHRDEFASGREAVARRPAGVSTDL